MKPMKSIIAALAGLLFASTSVLAAGQFQGLPNVVFPGTQSIGAPPSAGNAIGSATIPAGGCIPMDTGNPSGIVPATVCVSPSQLAAYGSGGARMYFQSAQIPVGIPLTSYGTDTVVGNGTIYFAEVIAGVGATITSISCLNGSVVGTDNLIYGLYSAAGAKLANTALGGVLSAGANAFQAAIPLTTPLVSPAGILFVTVQTNGTTARIRTINANASQHWIEFAVAGAFGALPASVNVPNTATPNVGPICVLQ
jgi:hypothetical protein